jgi:hypothetical protein
MKTLNCFKCNAYLGEIEKGKIERKAKLLCGKCHDEFFSFNGAPPDVPDFFKDLFGGK